jgi:YebC/PmpR family DNA-binding regulatory protein
MAGHSQFKNIMHRKGAQDARRARQFAKIIREITVAARSGNPDPTANPRLRAALTAARQANLSKDTIDRAVKKASGKEKSDDFFEVRYEGYGPGGVAVIVEALTDNRNRTASDVRSAFAKHGGALGETNSVSFQFNRVGAIVYPKAAASDDDMLAAAIDVGADDAESDDDFHYITCSIDTFFAVRDALEAKFGGPEAARIEWQATAEVPVDADTETSLNKLIDALEESDDVQATFTNAAG